MNRNNKKKSIEKKQKKTGSINVEIFKSDSQFIGSLIFIIYLSKYLFYKIMEREMRIKLKKKNGTFSIRNDR